MKQIFKSFLIIINIKALFVIGLSIACTIICLHYEVKADLPLAVIISMAVVFPIVFSIGGAYTRRETALRDYSNLKGHSRSIYLAARDWFEKESPEHTTECKKIIKDLFTAMRTYFGSPKSQALINEKQVYHNFSKLSKYINEMRQRGLPAGEMSRVNQYISKMMEAFENLKHVYQYRTPITLRGYSKLFIFITPIIFGPYFAHIGKDHPLWLALITPFIFSMVLVALDNIQDHLENPFDQIGEDDIKINPEKLVENFDA